MLVSVRVTLCTADGLGIVSSMHTHAGSASDRYRPSKPSKAGVTLKKQLPIKLPPEANFGLQS